MLSPTLSLSRIAARQVVRIPSTHPLALISSTSPQAPSVHSLARISSNSFRAFSSDSIDAAELVKKLSTKRMTSVTLNTLMDTGQGNLLQKHTSMNEEELSDKLGTAATDKILRQVANFLHRELPIRLAHRITDLENVPMMKDQPSVKQVKEWYTTSMIELHSANKILTNEDEKEFAMLLENIYERHAGVLVTMARGAYELRAAVVKGQYGEGGKADFDEMQVS